MGVFSRLVGGLVLFMLTGSSVLPLYSFFTKQLIVNFV